VFEADVMVEEIDCLANRFLKHPYDYLYEADLRSVLFTKMFERSGRVKIKGGFIDGDKDAYGGGTSIETNLVKCEYPSNTRFDIAVIDDAHINNGVNPKNDKFWVQPVKVGIELKLWQYGMDIDIWKDIHKLNNYHHPDKSPITGLALVFIHPSIQVMDNWEHPKAELVNNITEWNQQAVYLYLVNGRQRTLKRYKIVA